MIARVAQEEPNGCVAATLAMVLGVDYWSAAGMLADRKHGDCYSTVAQFQELWSRGWRTLPVGRIRDEQRNVIAPHPPEPFADIHIASVKVSEGSPVYHSVIWLRDGTVLDPLTDVPRTLADYHYVGGIHGLYPPEPGIRGRAITEVPPRNEYRGWTISYDPPPIPVRNCDWRATGPNYDAWTEGEGEWADNGQKATGATREELIADIDAWFEENEA